MTIADFIEISNELTNFYGKEEMTSFESKIWYEELQKLSKERFRQLTRECFRNNKFMPKLADVIEYNKSVPRFEKKDMEKQENCEICKNTGFVSYAKIDKEEEIEYFYAARCKCRNGMRLGKSIPTIDEVKIVI